MALAMVGEALISASVEILLNRIASTEFRDFFFITELNVSVLDEVKIKLLALNVVLNDAEEKHITVKAWVDELKDVVYDAEDLLDAINTESLGSKVKGESTKFTSQVRSLLSSRFTKFHRSMNSKLEAISRRLEHFVKQKDILGLQSVSRRVSCRTATDSLIESVVVAREDEKEKLLNMLLSDGDNKNNNNIEVITILGMGAWAWVSDDFDVFRLTKKIVESLTMKDCHNTNLDVLRVELKNNLREKKFLLVLDDLWNDKYSDWHHLTTPFSSGKKGSKIIVTTRQQRVAKVTHTFPICFLQQPHGEKPMELAGAECFDELLFRSLIEKDKTKAKEKFRMHNLIYDLAKLVSGKCYCYFESGEIPGTVRHLAFLTKWCDVSRRFEGLYDMNSLRTFRPQPRYPDFESYLTKMYLDLSYTSIKRLPDATFKLYKLQTLKLTNCKFLTHLPRQIGNLVNLRHLDISGTTLVEMHSNQRKKLRNLRNLLEMPLLLSEDMSPLRAKNVITHSLCVVVFGSCDDLELVFGGADE
ncbi:putative disease resistance RPP13-like protein 1 isoform A [Glycine soja]|uniref:Putative disease resistance RPP13-like protein 1 isoform A n=1 Tax=Glycine soja TaxID=3848 RepID=A0A445F0U9_GLYSO|nr:putative disease resistance RPP13-like protein 1 isoform A [Glycine soja]